MQEISFTVDPLMEQVFMTTINSRAGVSAVLIGTTLTVTVYDDEELEPAVYDDDTGEVGPLPELDFEPIEYEGGSGSVLSSGSGMRSADTEFDTIRDLMPFLDSTAVEIV